MSGNDYCCSQGIKWVQNVGGCYHDLQNRHRAAIWKGIYSIPPYPSPIIVSHPPFMYYWMYWCIYFQFLVDCLLNSLTATARCLMSFDHKYWNAALILFNCAQSAMFWLLPWCSTNPVFECKGNAVAVRLSNGNCMNWKCLCCLDSKYML